jgi:hypothetical protein
MKERRRGGSMAPGTPAIPQPISATSAWAAGVPTMPIICAVHVPCVSRASEVPGSPPPRAKTRSRKAMAGHRGEEKAMNSTNTS